MLRKTGLVWMIMALACSMVSYATENAGVVSEVEKIAGGFQFIEGPLWHPDGTLLFTDIPANRIMEWSPQGDVEVYREPSGNANGLCLDPQGRLLACEHGNRRISRTESEGALVVIADQWEGKAFNSPNDCVVRSDGMIFFTDPDYGLGGRKREIDFNGVYRVLPDSAPVLLFQDFNKPNGIALSPDETKLYVADTANSHVRVFDLASDGSATHGRVLFEVPQPDGMALDVQGNLYVTAQTGVEIFSPDGKQLAVIAFPEQPANCAFGGPENKILYVTARTGLYRVQMQHAGIPALSIVK